MPTKSSPVSESKIVRRVASLPIPAPSEADLDRLRSLPEPATRPDETDSPPTKIGSAPVQRDTEGRLVRPRPELANGKIRRAVLEQLGRRKMTRYQLWKTAKEHCATLSESAVYEFLRGQRDVQTQYAEALMAAVGLELVHKRKVK
jgi:hypothetical protein